MHEVPNSSHQETLPNVKNDDLLKTPRFNPRPYLTEVLKHAGTIGLNIGTVLLFETVSVAGGVGVAGVNPFSGLDPKIAFMVWMLSQVPFIHSLAVNAKEVWKSLEVTGTSISWPAKVSYEVSKRITKNESMQRVATYAGFASTEIVMEASWYAGTLFGKEKILEIAPEQYTPNMEFAFMTGANLTGTLYSYLQAGGVEGVLQGIKHRERLVNMVSGRWGRFSKTINNVIL